MTDIIHTAASAEDVRRATLVEAYWRLHDQAESALSAYYDVWASKHKDPASTEEARRQARERMYWIELERTGIRSAASTIAVMLGVHGCDLERPDSLIWSLNAAQALATDEQIGAYWDECMAPNTGFEESLHPLVRTQYVIDTRRNPEQLQKVAKWRKDRA